MITKYKTSRYSTKIEAVECTRESDKCVWIARKSRPDVEDRSAKFTDWSAFHDTWEAAHTYLLEKAEIAVVEARRRLQEANSKLGNIKGMKKPAA